MTSVVLYFQVHQPYRLARYRFFDIGHHADYFDLRRNAEIMRRVAHKCYLPMNRVLQEMIERYEGRFRCAFSITSTAIEQMQSWCPEALDSFIRLGQSGCVEFLGETSHHSLAALYNRDEFIAQIEAHRRKIQSLFGQTPTTFRNTELVLSNSIAACAESLGFSAILGEGADQLLGWRSPHHIYRPEHTQRIKALLRSYSLSDDIAFRFSNRAWSEWPLPADRFAHWLHRLDGNDSFVGLFMDYETFGEHQWEETGIFEFMRHLPQHVLSDSRFAFHTPSEAAKLYDPVARIDVPHPVSWADAERDLTAWLGNDMQRAAAAALYDLVPWVHQASAAGENDLVEKWRRLSTSDHVYYMCTKYDQDGDVHKYFSPHESPHEAFIAFMNVVDDLGRRLRRMASTPLRATA